MSLATCDNTKASEVRWPGGEKVANAHHILQTQVTILFAFENTVHSHTDAETAREAARPLTSMGMSNRV